MANNDDDTRAEPWPFHSEGRNETSPPPQLVSASRYNQPPEPLVPPAPPPLVSRKRGQEASTAPQSDDRTLGGIPPLTEIKKGSKAPKIDPANPPPLVAVKKPGSPPPLEIVQPKPAEPPKLEIKEPAAPPPLEVVQRKPVEAPKLEVKYLSPVVYLLIGRNHLNEEITLCQVSPEAEYQKAEKRGISDLRAFLIGLITSDFARFLETNDGKEIREHQANLELSYTQMTPQQKALGVVFKGELLDHHYHVEDLERQRSESDDPDDDDAEHTSDVPIEDVYSWMVVRCDLKQIPRLNLSAILSS